MAEEFSEECSALVVLRSQEMIKNSRGCRVVGIVSTVSRRACKAAAISSPLFTLFVTMSEFSIFSLFEVDKNSFSLSISVLFSFLLRSIFSFSLFEQNLLPSSTLLLTQCNNISADPGPEVFRFQSSEKIFKISLILPSNLSSTSTSTVSISMTNLFLFSFSFSLSSFCRSGKLFRIFNRHPLSWK